MQHSMIHLSLPSLSSSSSVSTSTTSHLRPATAQQVLMLLLRLLLHQHCVLSAEHRTQPQHCFDHRPLLHHEFTTTQHAQPAVHVSYVTAEICGLLHIHWTSVLLQLNFYLYHCRQTLTTQESQETTEEQQCSVIALLLPKISPAKPTHTKFNCQLVSRNGLSSCP